MADQIETGIIAESISQPPAFGRLLKIFRPANAASVQVTDPAEVSAKYRYWQKRVLLTSIIGYATFGDWNLAFHRRLAGKSPWLRKLSGNPAETSQYSIRKKATLRSPVSDLRLFVQV